MDKVFASHLIIVIVGLKGFRGVAGVGLYWLRPHGVVVYSLRVEYH